MLTIILKHHRQVILTIFTNTRSNAVKKMASDIDIGAALLTHHSLPWMEGSVILLPLP
jgi:hypothetical protein